MTGRLVGVLLGRLEWSLLMVLGWSVSECRCGD